MPTGSLCSERNVIGTALASDLTLHRRDIKMVAILSANFNPPSAVRNHYHVPILSHQDSQSDVSVAPVSAVPDASTTKDTHPPASQALVTASAASSLLPLPTTKLAVSRARSFSSVSITPTPTQGSGPEQGQQAEKERPPPSSETERNTGTEEQSVEAATAAAVDAQSSEDHRPAAIGTPAGKKFAVDAPPSTTDTVRFSSIVVRPHVRDHDAQVAMQLRPTDSNSTPERRDASHRVSSNPHLPQDAISPTSPARVRARSWSDRSVQEEEVQQSFNIVESSGAFSISSSRNAKLHHREGDEYETSPEEKEPEEVFECVWMGNDDLYTSRKPAGQVKRGRPEEITEEATTIGEVNLNPLGPCGACKEWLLKIAEVNPDLRIVTFADTSCAEVYVNSVDYF